MRAGVVTDTALGAMVTVAMVALVYLAGCVVNYGMGLLGLLDIAEHPPWSLEASGMGLRVLASGYGAGVAVVLLVYGCRMLGAGIRENFQLRSHH